MRRNILLIFCLVSLWANAANRRFAYVGKLGTDISFRLDLECEEYTGFVAGETTYYRKNGKTAVIKVFGQAYDTKQDDLELHALMLSEYNGTKVCGNYYIELDSKGNYISGTWALGDKGYEMNDIETLACAKTFVKPQEVPDATGVYEFTYDTDNQYMPEQGGMLQLYADRKNIAYTISQATPNIAEAEGTTSEFCTNYFFVSIANAQYTVYTYENAVFVKRHNPDDGPCSEFGFNADIAGVYVATGRQPEGDILDAFKAEKVFGGKLPCSVFELNEAWMDAVEGETTFPDLVALKDIDGDGNAEIIARYIAGKTDRYEVSGNRAVVFTVSDGVLTPVAMAVGDLEQLEIADGYVIRCVSNARATRVTYYYYKLSGSTVCQQAMMTEAEINNFTINGSTVKEKDFKKSVKIKNRQKVDLLDGMLEVPGNEKRNENAARG